MRLLKKIIKKYLTSLKRDTKISQTRDMTDQQIRDMEETLNNAECDIIIDGSPIDLGKLINSNKPIVRVKYDIQNIDSPTIEEVLDDFIKKFLEK